MTEQASNIFSKMQVYAQAWLDISAEPIHYHDVNSALFKGYQFNRLTQVDENGVEGVPGFSAEYWEVANNIFNYAASLNDRKIVPFAMSYNSYALAGYIAGDLFCQAMEALEKSGKALSRANLVEVMESQEFQVAMANKISFANGMRAGVDSFALTVMYDAYNLDPSLGGGVKHTAASATIHTLTSMEEYRALLAGN
jgi:hypothetical protein